MSTEVEVPEELDPKVTVQDLHPQYQYIELTPYQFVGSYNLKKDGICDNILQFEIPADNVMNLAKSFITCNVKIDHPRFLDNVNDDWLKIANLIQTVTPDNETTAAVLNHTRYSLDLLSYNIAYLRVYTSNGVNLFYVQDTAYSDYVDFIRPFERKKDDISATQFDNQFFDGGTYYDPLSSKQLYRFGGMGDLVQFRPYYTMDGCFSTDQAKADMSVTYTMVIKFSELYNSILSTKTDMYFGEKLKIDIKFGPIDKMACGEIHWIPMREVRDLVNIYERDEFFLDYDVNAITITNPILHMCYNQDAACNENTINYCLSNDINIADFHVITMAWPMYTDTNFIYQFNLNASFGPYLKYILVRCLPSKYKTWFDSDARYAITNTKSMWKINDWALTPDYVKWDNWEKWYEYEDYWKDSWFIWYTDHNFRNHPFDLLNFGSKNLVDLQAKDGKSLEKEIKFTYNMNTPQFTETGTDSAKWNTYGMSQKIFYFYVITGRVLKINKTGVEAIL